MRRTRIKICGITRAADLQAAVDAGVDALGFVFYAASARHVTVEQAAALCTQLPPFVTAVALFVNPTLAEVAEVVDAMPIGLLQFHGDETIEQCASIAQAVRRPFVRAYRVKPDTAPEALLEYERDLRAASGWCAGLLLDAYVDGYGGAGKVFDWSVIPKELAPRVVLSGGLNVPNVTDALVSVRPFAVDVSSGVEQSKGIKDVTRIAAFVAAVRRADLTPDSESPHANQHQGTDGPVHAPVQSP